MLIAKFQILLEEPGICRNSYSLAQTFYKTFPFFVCAFHSRCLFLHRTAGDTERRYHLRYYKTGSCIHETDAKGHCSKNGSHCAFAHGSHDLRSPVFDIRCAALKLISRLVFRLRVCRCWCSPCVLRSTGKCRCWTLKEGRGRWKEAAETHSRAKRRARLL